MALEQEIKQKLVKTLELKIDPESIDDSAPLFVEGLGLDSVDALEVAAMIATEFGIEIPYKATAKEAFASINALAAFIRKHQTAPA